MSDTMVLGSEYAESVSRFGADKGSRIFADALLLQADNGKPIADCLRIVVGSLKQIKRSRSINYDQELDMFDNQLVEGRHYSVESALTRETRRIDSINRTERSESYKVAIVVQAIHDRQADQDATPDTVLNARLWVEGYMRDLPPVKRAFVGVCIQRYQVGQPINQREQHRLRQHYMPKGIGYEAFLEVLCRYTKKVA